MADGSAREHRKWLSGILPRHDRLSVAVKYLLENMLKERRIEYLSISSRVKSLSGGLEKISRKQYSDPQEQLTDLSGIRVITFLEQHVVTISKAVRNLFEIDEANSLDRSETLCDDRILYRSKHFLSTLANKPAPLPHY